ncbi:MAG: NAD-dependent deacylase [Bacillaceae bacterium]|nr:NAD-dependent deacylase [Bacillaceae bacterium]
MNNVSIEELAGRVKEGNVVIFTGAGMSTESGLPDFRSNGGLWDGRDPMEIASANSLYQNFDEFTSFYRYRIEEKNKYAPHEGHRILAEWEKKGLVDAVITQNVDGYHRQAGSETVYELHGSLTDIYCETCGRTYTEEHYLQKSNCQCNGKLRPGIVLFGEALPVEAFEKSAEAARNCKTMLVIGTSLQVSPANMLPSETRSGGGNVILINREPVELFYLVDGWIEGSARDVLKACHEQLGL